MIRTNVDFERSRELRWMVSARNRECYENAIRAFDRLHDVPALRYVEGWVVWHHLPLPIPFEHGWLETQDGTIIDPTPIFCEGNEARTYYGAFYWTVAEFREHCVATLRANGEITLPLWEKLAADDSRHIAAVRVKSSIPNAA